MCFKELPNCQLPIDRNAYLSLSTSMPRARFSETPWSAILRIYSGNIDYRLFPEILDLIRQKKVIRKRLHNTGNPVMYLTLKAEISNAYPRCDCGIRDSSMGTIPQRSPGEHLNWKYISFTSWFGINICTRASKCFPSANFHYKLRCYERGFPKRHGVCNSKNLFWE